MHLPDGLDFLRGITKEQAMPGKAKQIGCGLRHVPSLATCRLLGCSGDAGRPQTTGLPVFAVCVSVEFDTVAIEVQRVLTDAIDVGNLVH